MMACLMGKATAVDTLLELGADPHVGENDGYTCLHGIGFQGRAEVATRVLTKYKDVLPNTMHADGFFPIHRAAWGKERRHTDTVAAFLAAGADHEV